MARSDDNGWSIIDAVFSFYSELFSFAIFSMLGAEQNAPTKPSPTVRRPLSIPAGLVDDPLEVPPFMRHLGSHPVHEIEGAEAGSEANMGGEFLSQLEQRTQQVKITLANLEGEKVRIEGLIAQLQPIIPHYDALITAERRLSEANIGLEPQLLPLEPPPAEGSGLSSEAPAGQEPGSGWSGSWNS